MPGYSRPFPSDWEAGRIGQDHGHSAHQQVAWGNARLFQKRLTFTVRVVQGGFTKRLKGVEGFKKG